MWNEHCHRVTAQLQFIIIIIIIIIIKIWNVTCPFGNPHSSADYYCLKKALQRESNQIPMDMRIPQDDVYPCAGV
jgi:hypothetical protein